MMCGIASIFLTPQERPPQVWQALKETFTQNLLANEDRGQAATGLAVLQTDGRLAIYKSPLPAGRFVTTPEYISLLEQLGPQTSLLLGHTRHPTKGDPATNDNNHPLLAGPICGIHNGHIDNDDELFALGGCPRQGQVDSELIFRLLEPLSPRQLNGAYLDAVQAQLRHLQGDFTFLACDCRAPDKLLVVRHHNKSLSVHFQPGWNVLIFSSRYIFLRKRFGRALLAEELPRDHLLLFEARSLAQTGHRPAAAVDLQLSKPNFS
jgi:glucosamine 6-phosphate synthetase-like amidotransferase/phosphosugar isomerase protein